MDLKDLINENAKQKCLYVIVVSNLTKYTKEAYYFDGRVQYEQFVSGILGYQAHIRTTPSHLFEAKAADGDMYTFVVTLANLYLHDSRPVNDIYDDVHKVARYVLGYCRTQCWKTILIFSSMESYQRLVDELHHLDVEHFPTRETFDSMRFIDSGVRIIHCTDIENARGIRASLIISRAQDHAIDQASACSIMAADAEFYLMDW